MASARPPEPRIARAARRMAGSSAPGEGHRGAGGGERGRRGGALVSGADDHRHLPGEVVANCRYRFQSRCVHARMVDARPAHVIGPPAALRVRPTTYAVSGGVDSTGHDQGPRFARLGVGRAEEEVR